MTLHFRREIEHLKEMILELGTIVEETLQNAITALAEGDKETAQQILDDDQRIDMKEVKVEEECLKILALHQPVARDLRYVIAVLKINNDLERVGDLASNIAERVLSVASERDIMAKFDFGTMLEMVLKMLRLSMNALINQDAATGREVCKLDDEVDRAHEEKFRIIQEFIIEDPTRAPIYIQYLSVSRYLERIADQTTNIAEDVIYMVEGDIIRHDKKKLGFQDETKKA